MTTPTNTSQPDFGSSPDLDGKGSDASSTVAQGLTRFSLKRRVTVFVMFLSLIVVGIISAIGLRLELIPDGMTGQQISVRVNWKDASPREVLDKVIIPLEDELSTVKGIDRLYSRARTGGGRASVKFKTGTDMDVAYREIRDRVERARVLFPEDIERPQLSKASVAGIPVYVVGITVDPGLSDYVDLVEREIVMPLERIDGVADVEIDGLAKREVAIDLDRGALEAAGLNAFEVSNVLSEDNFTLASGHTYSAGKKYLLRSVSKYNSLSDIENRLIAPNVRLKDIAKVYYGEEERRWEVRVNSKRAMAVKVIKDGSANTVEVASKAEALIEDLKRNPRLQFVTMNKIWSQGDEISSSINNLIGSGKIGAFFAALVLFFFLRRARLTLIIALSIPLSLLAALTAMYFLGQTLNVFTLLGLVICVGLLVDNAVVVAENIHRLYTQENLSRAQACIQGAGEIALAILTATLTTVIVFLPVSLVEGQGQFMLQQLSIPISSALIGSLFIALIFVPLCVYLTLDSRKKAHAKTDTGEKIKAVLASAYEHSFERLSRVYGRVLKFFLNHRIDMILLLLVIQVGVSFLAKQYLEVEMDTGNNDGSVKIRFRAPDGTDVIENKKYFEEIEKVLEKHKEKWQIKDYLIVFWRTGGRIEGWLEDDAKEDANVKEIAADIVKFIPEKAGYRLRYGQEDEGDEERRKNRYISIIQGENPELLEHLAIGIRKKMLSVDGVLGLQGDADNTPNEMALIIDRDRAAQANVNSKTLAQVIAGALRGRPLPNYNDKGREVNMLVRFEEADREKLSDLGTFYVPTGDKTLLAVNGLTDVRMLDSAKQIRRREKKISLRMTFDIDPEKAKETKDALRAIQNNYALPEGVTFNTKISTTQNHELKQMTLAALLSVVFIYLLMGFLFESFILPLSILLTIPLAFVGVQAGHLALGISMDALGVIGGVLLVGVVVNNGIVLVDYIQRLRNRGYQRHEALLLSVKRRFRPIIMTALTTIIGMVPLTLSPPGAMGIEYKSFGVTLIAGMTTASFLTLFVVPVFYSIFDDMRQASFSLIKHAFYRDAKKSI